MDKKYTPCTIQRERIFPQLLKSLDSEFGFNYIVLPKLLEAYPTPKELKSKILFMDPAWGKFVPDAGETVLVLLHKESHDLDLMRLYQESLKGVTVGATG